jgi:hypothetical protein
MSRNDLLPEIVDDADENLPSAAPSAESDGAAGRYCD